MKRRKQMQKAFGINEFGQADLPVKISNVQISRIIYGNESGCSYCFPHGFETSNSTIANWQRNWKCFRKTQWRHCNELTNSPIDLNGKKPIFAPHQRRKISFNR